MSKRVEDGMVEVDEEEEKKERRKKKKGKRTTFYTDENSGKTGSHGREGV